MTRAVLLGTGAYPLIISRWLKNLDSWKQRIDHVYLSVDRYAKPEYKEFLHKKVMNDPKIILLEDVEPWPQSYKSAFLKSTEDLFLIMHDDTFITDNAILDLNFILSEDKVVTPLHEIYSPADVVEPWLRKKYPGKIPFRTPHGEKGYSFLLYLIFISRENMNKTSLNFNGWGDGVMAADTGFIFMMDLLDKGVDILALDRDQGYTHNGNVGNTIPDLLDDEKELSPNWDKESLKKKIDFIDKCLASDDFSSIPGFLQRIQKRLAYLKGYL